MVDCVTPESAHEVMENYRRRISGEVPSIHYFTKGVRKDGRLVHLELHASRVNCRGRPALAGVALDVTERVQRQEELRRSREQLRELTRHINTAREVERARLAREVHDVLGGMLSSAKFDLARIVRRTRTPELEELNRIASDLVHLMQETIDTARSISDEMRPISLDLLGLHTALKQVVEHFGERHRIAVNSAALVTLPMCPPRRRCRSIASSRKGDERGPARPGKPRRAGTGRDSAGIHASFGRRRLRHRCRCEAQRVDRLVQHGGAGPEIGATLDVRPAPAGGTEFLLRLPLSAGTAAETAAKSP